MMVPSLGRWLEQMKRRRMPVERGETPLGNYDNRKRANRATTTLSADYLSWRVKRAVEASRAAKPGGVFPL